MNLSTTVIKKILEKTLTIADTQYDVKKAFENLSEQDYTVDNLRTLVPNIDLKCITQSDNTLVVKFLGYLFSFINSTDNGKRINKHNIDEIEEEFKKYYIFKKATKINTYHEQLINMIDRGYLSILVEKNPNVENAEWVIDLSFMEDIETDGCLRYGGLLKLNLDKKNIQIVSITYRGLEHFPTDRNFNKYINIVLSSAFVCVTMLHHALISHMFISGQAFETLLEFEDKKSDLAKIIHLFTYNSGTVNYKAIELLLKNNGMLHKLFGFTSAGFNRMLEESYKRVSVDKLMKTVNILSDKLFIMNQLKLWLDAIDKFVSDIEPLANETFNDKQRFVDVYGKRVGVLNGGSTSFKYLMKILIFNATSYHAFVGNIMYYHGNPRFLNMKIKNDGNDDEYPTIQEYYILLTLTMATSYENMPKLMNDWEPIFDNPNENSLYRCFLRFQQTLRELETEFGRMDPTFTLLFPSTMECSVSL